MLIWIYVVATVVAGIALVGILFLLFLFLALPFLPTDRAESFKIGSLLLSVLSWGMLILGIVRRRTPRTYYSYDYRDEHPFGYWTTISIYVLLAVVWSIALLVAFSA